MMATLIEDRKTWPRVRPATAADATSLTTLAGNGADARWFVAERAGDIIGAIGLADGDEGDMTVQMLSVDDAWRGRGIAQMLVLYAIVWARDQHASRLTVAVPSTETQRQAWYESLGFERSEPGKAMIRFARKLRPATPDSRAKPATGLFERTRR